MRCAAFVLTLLALTARASEDDIQSAACRGALAALQEHESALATSAPRAPADQRPAAGADPAWRALRARAAQICLGGEPDAPPPRGATAPPTAVPPVSATPTATPAPRAPPPPLPARTLPPIVTGCDGAGCWTSEGERLPQFGRSPFDGRVHCTVQGRIVMCL